MKHMNKALALLLSVLMLAAAASAFPASAEVDPKDFNTSIPTCFYDFSESLYDSVIANVSFTMTEKDGYLSLTATQDDPSLNMVVPQVPLEQLRYVNVKYRLHAKKDGRYAEVYYAASNGESMAEQTKIKWFWEDNSGEWATQTAYMSSWDDKPGVFLTSFRFDAMAGDYSDKLQAGEGVDLAYLAFFETEEQADSFNVDEYRRYLAAVESSGSETEGETTPRVIEPGDYRQPEPADMILCAEDSSDGSLTLTHNGDGTLTVSYLQNGETVTYTVPDSLLYSCGPLVGTDDLDRTLWDQFTEVDPDYTGLSVTGKVRNIDAKPFTIGVTEAAQKREIGLFYFLWLGEHGDSGIQDISKIVAQYGESAGRADCPGWGPVFSIHHFAEPLYGYYYSIDTWVMRKHVELLCNAGVDFLYFDTTNNYAYAENVKRLMTILHEFNERGWNAPKVCFYTHTDAEERVKIIYNSIYKKNIYPDTWYCFDGKPLIIAPASANIDDFFTTREPQWPNEQQKRNAWPWIDWNWPQRVYRDSSNRAEAVSVSVAQHAGNGCFSESALYGYEGNWGRSFNGTNDLLTDDSYKLGLNIQNEFNYAMTTDCPVVLVTGWNEWIAGRQPQIKDGQPVVFIDTFNYEYSRDIEMARGAYFDNYYMQLISNIRALKGSAPTIVQDARNPINVTGGFDQWDKVIVDYPDPEGDTVERSCVSFGHTVLTDTTGRNDITDIKVTSDTTNLYFYIKTADTVQRPAAGTDSAWMQLFLNVDRQQTGWYGYDFVLNHSPKSDTVTTLAACAEDGKCVFNDVCDVNYRVFGNEMMIEVPLAALGITQYDRIAVQFKAMDSDNAVDEMEDFYIEGDAAPLGRPDFMYQNYIPGVTEGEGHAVLSAADKQAQNAATDTDAPASDTVSEPSGSDTSDSGSSGCGSLIALPCLLPALLFCGAWCVRKKRFD
ncbi:MAG: hypothetical protein MJ192_07850 [Clostridia bacterium]|nr:hypothetical protein [Clostridia bacterium]